MTLESRRIGVYAAYRQFYIEDADRQDDPTDPEFWTDEALDNRLAVIPGRIGVITASYDSVDVLVEIHGGPPDLELAEWDHVTELGLDVPSGRINLVGCM